MPGPAAVDVIVDGSTTSHALTLLWVQRAMVGPALYNVQSDLYGTPGSSTNAALVTAASGAPVPGTGLIVIPPTVSGMTPPAAPTVTPTLGAAGLYAYFIIAINANGDAVASQYTEITNGPTTLDGTHFNTVSWNSVTGATSYKVVRARGPGAEGVVATQAGTSFNDTGGAVTSYVYQDAYTSVFTNATLLDLRYLPTNQANGITRGDMRTNGNLTSQFKLFQVFGAGNNNGAVLCIEAFLNGGSGTTAGPDGESVGLYSGVSRTAGTRSAWAANFLMASSVVPSASMSTYGLEVDTNNNSGTDATASTPFDAIQLACAGTNKSRYGMWVTRVSPGQFIDGIHVAANSCSGVGVSIDALAAPIGIQCQAHIVGGGAAPTLGALQAGISSQSISGSDNRMNVSVTSAGASPPGAFAAVAIVTYAAAYASAPVLAKVLHDTTAGITDMYLSSTAASTFTMATMAAMPISQTVQVYFVVIG